MWLKRNEEASLELFREECTLLLVQLPKIGIVDSIFSSCISGTRKDAQIDIISEQSGIYDTPILFAFTRVLLHPIFFFGIGIRTTDITYISYFSIISRAPQS